VLAIGFADLMADANYEMALSVLPLFLTQSLGAPALAIGLVEGVADGLSAAVKLLSGWYSDRIAWRRRLAAGGYGATVVGFGLVTLVTAWPQVIAARGLAWMGRGLRQPIRSAMLAGSVEKQDLGKAFGFHEAMDTLGALAGPAIALLLIHAGHDFRTVFAVSVLPGIGCVAVFALLTRDPRRAIPVRPPRWQPLPARFWRLMVAVAVFGAGDFAPAFFTLRAAEMLRPEFPFADAAGGAVAFFLGKQAIGSAASFPAGWLADRIGQVPVLALGYVGFSAGCALAIAGHGPLAVAALAAPVGIATPLVNANESSLTSSLVEEPVLGTAFGVLNGINGIGDMVSSVIVGALWSTAGAVAGLSFGGLLGLGGALLLLALQRGHPARQLVPPG
jgi:MFS family permease